MRVFIQMKQIAFSMMVMLLTANAHAAAPSWQDLARQVGQSEKSRPQAIEQLKKMKNLDKTLIKALETPSRSLAVDVICALQLKNLLPQMLERLAVDEDGFLTLGINSLLDSETKELILNGYKEKLSPERPQIYSPASIIAMLEPLGRLGTKLSKETLQALSTHDFPEVRSAGLSYLRTMTLQHQNKENMELLSEAMKASQFQMRIQALFFVQDLAKDSKLKSLVSKREVSDVCDKEKNASVMKQCQAALKKLGAS